MRWVASPIWHRFWPVKAALCGKALLWRTSHFENVLGTSMEIKPIAKSDADADRAEDAALAEIKRLNGILSGHDPSRPSGEEALDSVDDFLHNGSSGCAGSVGA